MALVPRQPARSQLRPGYLGACAGEPVVATGSALAAVGGGLLEALPLAGQRLSFLEAAQGLLGPVKDAVAKSLGAVRNINADLAEIRWDDMARAMGAARPATLVHPGRHVTWYGDDTQRSRAIAILNALLGSWGRKGGFFVPSNLPIPPYEYPGYLPHDEQAADRPAPGASKTA